MNDNESAEEPQSVVILHESVFQSVVRDLFTFAMVVGIIGVGVVVGSSAMQWVGFLMVITFLFAKGLQRKVKSIKTPQEAAYWLKAKFGVSA